MEKQWDFGRCIAILNQEIALLGRIYAVQTAVREAVLRQEWTDFDWKMAEVKQMGTEFGQLDDERASLFTSLAVSFFGLSVELPPFYALASKLPQDERRELSRLYRLLKMETFKIQALNESFLDYLIEAKVAASAYLEAVFPDRGGKLYNSNGSKSGQDLKSLVFNRQI